MLDVLEALEGHRDSLIIVGAHAIYLQVPSTQTAVAPFTRDSDMVINPEKLLDEPLIDELLARTGFTLRDPNLPGSWVRGGDELDLMVPHGVSKGGRRSARISPHAKHVARKTKGLEGTLVDNKVMELQSLEPELDNRRISVRVAGPAALLVSKLYKLHERLASGRPDRQHDKDAHDVYRILLQISQEELAERYGKLLNSEASTEVASTALSYLQEQFADDVGAPGSTMAGRTEEGIGNPAAVSLQVSILAAELLQALSER